MRVFAPPDRWEASVSFYESLGLKNVGRNSDAGWAVFTGELPALLIVEREIPHDGEAEGFLARFAAISFAVADIQSVYREMNGRGVPFVAPPERQEWGGWTAHFKDPAGNTLTLVQSP